MANRFLSDKQILELMAQALKEYVVPVQFDGESTRTDLCQFGVDFDGTDRTLEPEQFLERIARPAMHAIAKDIGYLCCTGTEPELKPRIAFAALDTKFGKQEFQFIKEEDGIFLRLATMNDFMSNEQKNHVDLLCLPA